MRKGIVLLLGCLIAIALQANEPTKKPLLVGITDTNTRNSTGVSSPYVEAIREGGNLAVVIPFTTDSVLIDQTLSRLDAVLIPGGEDVNPDRYGAPHSPHLGAVNDARDTFDMMVIRLAVKRHIPILGICRGMQIINVCFGGTLYQDLPTERPDSPLHHQGDASKTIHQVVLDRQTDFGRMMGMDSLWVNSTHHQAVKDVAPGFRITARATDGVIEGIESPQRGITAIQFHPESLIKSADQSYIHIFKKAFRK